MVSLDHKRTEMGKEGLFSSQNSPATCGWICNLEKHLRPISCSVISASAVVLIELQLELCHCLLYAPFVPKDC